MPSGNVPSTCTSSTSSPTPGNTWFTPKKEKTFVNPSHSSISMLILYTVCYALPNVLTRFRLKFPPVHKWHKTDNSRQLSCWHLDQFVIFRIDVNSPKDENWPKNCFPMFINSATVFPSRMNSLSCNLKFEQKHKQSWTTFTPAKDHPLG